MRRPSPDHRKPTRSKEFARSKTKATAPCSSAIALPSNSSISIKTSNCLLSSSISPVSSVPLYVSAATLPLLLMASINVGISAIGLSLVTAKKNIPICHSVPPSPKIPQFHLLIQGNFRMELATFFANLDAFSRSHGVLHILHTFVTLPMLCPFFPLRLTTI